MAEQIKNINFNVDTKEKFTIDGDANKVIELDVTDINIVSRYSEAMEQMQSLKDDYNKINEISKKVQDNENDVDLEVVKDFTKSFKEVEYKMRDIVDYIFDSKICDTILGKSSIFSPVNGGYFKYEQILEVLSNLYAKSIKSDMDKINKKHIQKHTVKYTGVK